MAELRARIAEWLWGHSAGAAFARPREASAVEVGLAAGALTYEETIACGPFADGARLLADMAARAVLSSSDERVARFTAAPAEELAPVEFWSSVYSDMLMRGAARLVIEPGRLLKARLIAATVSGDVLIEDETGAAVPPEDTITVPDGPVPRVVSARIPVRAWRALNRNIAEVAASPLLQKQIVGESILGQTKTTEAEEEMKGRIARQFMTPGVGFAYLGGEQRPLTVTFPQALSREVAEFQAYLVRQIAAALNVPPFLVGASSDEKYSNLTARMASLIGHGVLPLVERLASVLTMELGAEVRFDVSPIYRADLRSAVELAAKAVAAGVATPREARGLLGLDGEVANAEALDRLAPPGLSTEEIEVEDPDRPRAGEEETDDGDTEPAAITGA